MRRSRAGLAVLLAAAALAVGACGDRTPVAEADRPMRVMLSPSHGAEPAELERLASALAERAALQVEFQVAESTQAAVARAGTDRYDAAILPLFEYLFCHQEYGVRAGLQVVRGDGARSYRGELLVLADSPLTAPRGLDGKRVAFVDRYSTSGFLFPAALLAEARATPIPAFLGSHDAALAELRQGGADAAAVFAGASGGDSAFRSLAQTGPIPNEPIFFRAGLDDTARTKLIGALLLIAGTPEGAALFHPLADIDGFAPVDDAAYEDAHETIQAAGHRVEDLVPQGWRLRHENDRSLLGDFAL